MKKGLLYTLVGIDGLKITREKGIEVALNGDTHALNTENIDEELLSYVAVDVDGFMEQGLDVIVTVEQGTDNVLYADSVVEVAVEGGFDDPNVDFDDDDDDDDAANHYDEGTVSAADFDDEDEVEYSKEH